MTILFWGEASRPNGPGNVNRGYRAHLPKSFLRIQSKGKYPALAEGIGKLMVSRCLVVSGVSRQGCILAGMAKLLSKKTVYLMHGSAAREAEWYSCEGLKQQEDFLMKKASLILCVSRTFRDWVREAYPRYGDKTQYLYPGVDIPAVAPRPKVPGTVAAAGGDGGIKGNAVLARAVEAMDGAAKLTVFGGAEISHPGRHTTYAGRLPREVFWKELAQTQLFVLNSRFESFSLSTIEALLCGCSILVSEKAGVAELLALEEGDVIHDPMDEAELRRKIANLLENPNHDRLLASLDLERVSWQRAAENLEAFCADLIRGERL